MGRIMAVDYGAKRTGLAVTDSLKIIAPALDTLPTEKLIGYLKGYFSNETVEELVIGMPKQLDGKDSGIAPQVRQFVDELNRSFPWLKVIPVDERFTSQIAQRAMIAGGMKKMERRKKENVDRISATLILQAYMDSRG